LANRDFPEGPVLWPWILGGVGLLFLLMLMAAVAYVGLRFMARRDELIREVRVEVPPEAHAHVEEKPAPVVPQPDIKPVDVPQPDVKPDRVVEKKDPPPVPGQAITVTLDQGKYEYNGRITDQDRATPARGKVFVLAMQKGRTYVIHHNSNEMDAFLHLQDANGKVLASDDDSGGGLNAMLRFKAPATGNYRIIATSLGGFGKGEFTLNVRQEGAGSLVIFPKTLPNVALPMSTSPNQPLGPAAVSRAPGQPATSTISLKGDTLVGEPCWAKDGRAFFTLDGSGILRRITTSDFREEKRLELGHKCGSLATSADGLVVAVIDLQEAWVIDPATLLVKKRVAAPGVARVTAAPQSPVAVAVTGNDGINAAGDNNLMVLDLARGQPVMQYGLPTRYATLTPDGKYLFSETGTEELQRIRLEGNKLEPDLLSPRVGQNAKGITVSPDGKYVCMPSGGGNLDIPGTPHTAYATYVFAVDNLEKPAFTVAAGPFPQAVGFDPRGGHVFAQKMGMPLILFTFTGLKKRDVPMALPGGEDPLQFLAHPDGGQLLIRTSRDIVFVDLAPALRP
jgi:hypothetical protein